MKYRIVEYPGHGFMAQVKRKNWVNLDQECWARIETAQKTIENHMKARGAFRVVHEEEG